MNAKYKIGQYVHLIGDGGIFKIVDCVKNPLEQWQYDCVDTESSDPYIFPEIVLRLHITDTMLDNMVDQLTIL